MKKIILTLICLLCLSACNNRYDRCVECLMENGASYEEASEDCIDGLRD
jgi:hypothetical protein